MAANVSLPFTHTAGKPQDASEFMANLRAIQTWITTNAQLLDGTVAMMGTLTGPASDPSTTAQYMRKSYVDAFITALAASRVTGDRDTVRHGCSIRRTTNLLVTTTPTLFTFDTEDYDTDGFHAANASDIIIPSGMGGTYIVYARYGNAALQGFVCAIYVNGVLLDYGGSRLNAPQTFYDGAAYYLLQLGVGDTVRLYGSTSVGSTNITNARLMIHRIGAS